MICTNCNSKRHHWPRNKTSMSITSNWHGANPSNIVYWTHTHTRLKTPGCYFDLYFLPQGQRVDERHSLCTRSILYLVGIPAWCRSLAAVVLWSIYKAPVKTHESPWYSSPKPAYMNNRAEPHASTYWKHVRYMRMCGCVDVWAEQELGKLPHLSVYDGMAWFESTFIASYSCLCLHYSSPKPLQN